MATSDRREYLTATVMDQAFLDRCEDNLEHGIDMVADVETPGGTIYVSNKNKYIDGIFYEALTDIPVVRRSIGEWLSPEIEFSRLTLPISNVDGRYNIYNPGGASYAGWIDKRVDIKIGLRDVGTTYATIYSGRVTDIGGVQRDRAKITLITRDIMDRFSTQFPTKVLTKDSFPDIEDNLVGTVAPIIYGDWTIELNAAGASVPAYPLNGASAGVLAGTTSLQLIVSDNDNKFFDTSGVLVKRGEIYYPVTAADVTVITANRIFSIKLSGTGGVTTIDGNPYVYVAGDLFLVKIKGIDLGAYDDNIVWQARDILRSYAGAILGDFDANWVTYRDKASPAQDAVSLKKSRVWLQEPQSTIQYVLSMLEQVRLEPFQSRDLKLKLFALHFAEFPAPPAHVIRNWDIESDSLNPMLDDRNNWNRVKADYAFDPVVNENGRSTPIFRNDAAITQWRRTISKKIVFPNLYIEADVTSQLQEMLKLATCASEFIEVNLTPRSLLMDIGDFVLLNLDFAAIVYDNAPAIIRDLGYDAKGPKLPARLWSLQMTPYPGYAPGYAGIVGGYNATITQET